MRFMVTDVGRAIINQVVEANSEEEARELGKSPSSFTKEELDVDWDERLVESME